ncbi:MAG: phage virion morphogenesis protein [Pseudomonadota bacterium]
MTGVRLTVQDDALGQAVTRLGALGKAIHEPDLLAIAGAVVESSTRDRFDTKVAPDGTPWAPWSAAYAKTRKPRHSLLVSSGGLRDSIASFIDTAAGEVSIGSNLVYAAVQQFGGGELDAALPASKIPARPFLGISDEDRTGIERAISTFVEEILAE